MQAAPSIKEVPPSEELRRRVEAEANRRAAVWDRNRLLSRHAMEMAARELLADLGLPAAYGGWTMVALASAFWRDRVAAVPFDRRLLLLPHCLRNADACQAPYDAEGLHCLDCGACELTRLRHEAARLGYRVMIAEGSPAVMQRIVSGQVDAIIGSACLDSLEGMLDKVLLAGVPCMAVPLLCNGCRNTRADLDQLRAMMATPHRQASFSTRTYLHLMRAAARLFDREQLARLLPAGSAPAASEEPTAAEAAPRLACDFLAAGGKHSRPFVTLAAYDALSGGRGSSADGARYAAELPDAVRCVSLAIEVFHKASLIHDDIEDGDAFRYGRPTLHRAHGVPAAVNVGDYLIGLGYRLVAEQRRTLGAEATGDILAEFARAHTMLCEGQGAELAWRTDRLKRITPRDVLRIYALKTAPAFGAALYSGIRMAGPAEAPWPVAQRFARHLGVAYQIINDLDDWQADPGNKRHSGTDLLGARPTVLLALALERLSPDRCKSLLTLLDAAPSDERREGVRELYEEAGAFSAAAELIRKHHARAGEIAAESSCDLFRRLLDFLADAILDRRPLSVS